MLEHKYDLGDVVYGIRRYNEPVMETCSQCGGEGQHTWKSGSKVRCSLCWGSGTVTRDHYSHWTLDRNHAVLCIGQVRVKCTQVSQYPGADVQKSVKYMCWQSGVGGGTLWAEKDLWPSKAEARAECARRNQEAADAK